MDIIWISLDIFMDTVKISQTYPLISSQYPELSIYLSRAIHLFIHIYPSTYPELSIYLSRAIHILIQRNPYSYPQLSIHLSRAIYLISSHIHLPIQRYPSTYPAISCNFSCWIIDPVSAGPVGRCELLMCCIYAGNVLHIFDPRSWPHPSTPGAGPIRPGDPAAGQAGPDGGAAGPDGHRRQGRQAGRGRGDGR